MLGTGSPKYSDSMCASDVPTHHFSIFSSASPSSEWNRSLQFSMNKSEKHPYQVQKGCPARNHTGEPVQEESAVVAESGLWPDSLIHWYFQSYRGCQHLQKPWIHSGAFYSINLCFLQIPDSLRTESRLPNFNIYSSIYSTNIGLPSII